MKPNPCVLKLFLSFALFLCAILAARAQKSDNYEVLLQNRIVRITVRVSGGVSDETVLVFHPSASNGYDKYDSEKISNGNAEIPEIYTTVETLHSASLQYCELAINGMQPVTSELYLPLGFRTGRENMFSISATFKNFDGLLVLLCDNITGEYTNLTNGEIYTFPSDICNSAERFTLKIRGNMTNMETAEKR